MPEHLLAVAVLAVAVVLVGWFLQQVGDVVPSRTANRWWNLGSHFLSPIVIEFFVFVSVMALVSTQVLSLADLQTELWFVTILTVLIGDFGTTALLGYHGIEADDLGYTSWVCGELPSVRCAFSSRAVILLVVGGTYFGLITLGDWRGTEILFETILYIPVILAAGGLAATLINVQTLLAHRRES